MKFKKKLLTYVNLDNGVPIRYNKYNGTTTNRIQKATIVVMLVISLFGAFFYAFQTWQNMKWKVAKYMHEQPGEKRKPMGRSYAKLCSLQSECVIRCQNLDFMKEDNVRTLYETIEQARQKNVNCSITLVNAIYPQNTIHKNWIHLDPDLHPPISKLELDGNLVDIEGGGFECLPDLNYLTLKNTHIVELRRNAFGGLQNLRTLELHHNQLLKSAESGLIQDLDLETLSVQEMDLNKTTTVTFLGNLTAGIKSSRMSTLDWSYNSIGFFPKFLLENFGSLIQVFLRSTDIEGFEIGTFDNKNVLATLDLTGNFIEQLPEETFGSFVEHLAALYVQSNRLVCDCEMEWLQRFVKEDQNSQYGDFAAVNCTGPEENAHVPFLDANMCQLTTEETTSSDTPQTTKITEVPTTIPTTTPTTLPPDLSLSCQYDIGFTRYRYFEPERVWTNNRSDMQAHLPVIKPVFNVNVPTKKYYFSIVENEKSKKLEVRSETKSLVKSMFWMNITDPSNIQTNYSPSCVISQKSVMNIDNCTPNTTYLICMFDVPQLGEEIEINVLDCAAYKTNLRYGDQPWLTNSSISEAAAISVFAILLAMLIGAALLFVLVKRNPVLIRGSKRVIVVKHRETAQVMVMPSGYCGTAKYTLTDSESPTSPVPMNADTLSVVSYISAIQPTPLEIFTYQLERLQARSRQDIDNEGNPPPLPPYPIELSPRRLPPNVDLLLEYEWYTTTTTTTTTINE